MRGQRAGDFFGGGADVDEQRQPLGISAAAAAPMAFFSFGGDEPSRFVGEISTPEAMMRRHEFASSDL